jgi:choline dehydrogenase-like flavoprotein
MTTTDHHPIGTCKMGPEWDKMAVVSPRGLKVYGVENLRVIDGSVMPTMPSGNINVPIIMMAEKVSEMIKSDYFP